MNWRVAVLCGVGSLACERPGPRPAPALGLKVPRPEGWQAIAVGQSLEVGPKGQAALTLQSSTEPLPTAAALKTSMQRGGALELTEISSQGFVGFTHRLADDAGVAFVGVKADGSSSVRCASTPRAVASDVELAIGVCRQVSREVPP